MIIGTFNIRGGANTLKKRRISSLIKNGRADVFFIQETKLVDMQDFCLKVRGVIRLLGILSQIRSVFQED